MKDTGSGSRKKLYITTAVSGVASIASYILLFTHQEWVIRNYTRGSWYALLPIGTAFYFSLVHGTFCSCLLSVCGFRIASKAAPPEKTPDESLQGEGQTC